MRFLIFAVFLLISSPLASAQERPSGTETPPATTADDTRVDVDQDAGTLTIVVKGQPVAVFDADGLHVRDDVDYGGKLTDTGPAAFDKRLGGREQTPAETGSQNDAEE